jgi:predicted negative regulator of RcsB-dependent stress response
LDIHRSEEEQIEALRAWWAENGRSAVFGVVLGLGAIFGYRAWQASEVADTEAASMQYRGLLVAMRQPGSEAIRQQADAVLQQYPDRAYGVFAAMILAKTAVDAGELEKAAALLESARKENRDRVFDAELGLRLASVQSAQGRHDAALATLNDLSAKEYTGAVEELRGDIEARRGNADQARSAYKRALAEARRAGADSSILELKLDNLGHSGST